MIVFATGLIFLPFLDLLTSYLHTLKCSLGEASDQIREICGEEVASRIKKIWGMNSEGEINGIWRDIGVSNMWCALGIAFLFDFCSVCILSCILAGNLALCRFHSKHIALRRCPIHSVPLSMS